MEIEIRPISRGFEGDHTGRSSVTASFRLRPVIDRRTRRYNTGLSPADIKHAKKLGVTEDLSDEYSEDRVHPMWGTALGSIVLSNYPILLDLENGFDFIRYKIALASRFVANSLDELKAGKWPEAKYYIHNEEEEMQRLADIEVVRDQVSTLLREASQDMKINLLMVLDGIDARNFSAARITVLVGQMRDKDPRRLLMYLEKDKGYIAMYAMVQRAIRQRLIQDKAGQLVFADVSLGVTVDDAIAKFSEPEMSALYVRLENQLL